MSYIFLQLGYVEIHEFRGGPKDSYTICCARVQATDHMERHPEFTQSGDYYIQTDSKILR